MIDIFKGLRLGHISLVQIQFTKISCKSCQALLLRLCRALEAALNRIKTFRFRTFSQTLIMPGSLRIQLRLEENLTPKTKNFYFNCHNRKGNRLFKPTRVRDSLNLLTALTIVKVVSFWLLLNRLSQGRAISYGIIHPKDVSDCTIVISINCRNSTTSFTKGIIEIRQTSL